MEALLPHFHERREGSHSPTPGAVSLRDRRRCSRRLGDLLEQAGALVSGQLGSETLLARCGGRQPTSASDGGGLASRNSERRSSEPPGRNHGTSSGDRRLLLDWASSPRERAGAVRPVYTPSRRCTERIGETAVALAPFASPVCLPSGAALSFVRCYRLHRSALPNGRSPRHSGRLAGPVDDLQKGMTRQRRLRMISMAI
jgi:hypothetical protein